MICTASCSSCLELEAKDGWDMTRHKKKGQRYGRQIPQVKTVVLWVGAVRILVKQGCAGNIDYVRELGR